MANAARKVWVRCDDPRYLEQVKVLADQLHEDLEPVEFVCTLPDAKGYDALTTPVSQRDVRDFLDYHRPFAMLWIGGVLDQASLSPCYAVDLPVIVLEGSDRMLSRIMGSWMPHRARATLANLDTVVVPNERIKKEFVAGGAPEAAIHIAGSISQSSPVLPHNEDERMALADLLGTRAVWLAVAATPRDTTLLCDAHREALKRAHRLLLIITPQQTRDGREIEAQCKGFGFNTSLRSNGGEPDEATQVYVADDDDELGLWYRLAPITFACGSFGSGAEEDPFHAATLGSVVVHGPIFGDHLKRFNALIAEDATAPVIHPDDLGSAIAQLLSVDRAAAKANAGWDVTSRGAGAAVLVTDKIKTLLDQETA